MLCYVYDISYVVASHMILKNAMLNGGGGVEYQNWPVCWKMTKKVYRGRELVNTPADPLLHVG